MTAQDAANSSGQTDGVAVVSVAAGGAAASGGVQPGDVIVGLNQTRVTSLAALQTTLAQYPPGTRVTVYYVRDSGTSPRAATVTLGSLSS